MVVSIIIPSYQSEKYLSRAIRSAVDLNYDSKLYEIIVVNDGSTDNTKSVLETFSDDIVIINHETNKGLPAARNTGLQRAKGRYVINLDSDDYLHHDILKVGTLFLDLNTDMSAVAFDYVIVVDKERHITRVSAKDKPIACGIMFRKEAIIDIGLYDEGFLLREEEDLRIRFEKKYCIHNVPLPLYRYRRHDNNITNDSDLMNEFKGRLDRKHRYKNNGE